MPLGEPLPTCRGYRFWFDDGPSSFGSRLSFAFFVSEFGMLFLLLLLLLLLFLLLPLLLLLLRYRLDPFIVATLKRIYRLLLFDRVWDSIPIVNNSYREEILSSL